MEQYVSSSNSNISRGLIAPLEFFEGVSVRAELELSRSDALLDGEHLRWIQHVCRAVASKMMDSDSAACRLIEVLQSHYLSQLEARCNGEGLQRTRRPLASLVIGESAASLESWLSAVEAHAHDVDGCGHYQQLMFSADAFATAQATVGEYGPKVTHLNLELTRTSLAFQSRYFEMSSSAPLFSKSMFGEVARHLPAQVLWALPRHLEGVSDFGGVMVEGIVSLDRMDELVESRLRPMGLPLEPVSVHRCREVHPYVSFIHDYAHLLSQLFDDARVHAVSAIVRASLRQLGTDQGDNPAFAICWSRVLDGPSTTPQQDRDGSLIRFDLRSEIDHLFRSVSIRFDEYVEDGELSPAQRNEFIPPWFESLRQCGVTHKLWPEIQSSFESVFAA